MKDSSSLERRIEDLERIVTKLWIDVPGGPPEVLTLTRVEEEIIKCIADRVMEGVNGGITERLCFLAE